MKSRRANKRAKKSGKDAIDLDKRIASIHEAGHAVVALRVGAQLAQLTVNRDLTRNLATESAYGATCETWGLTGKVNIAARAYAGVIAEMLFHDGDFNITAAEIWEYIDMDINVPSATDLIGIESVPRNYRLRAINRALEVLKKDWTCVRGVAFELYESPQELIVISPLIFEQTKWRGLL